METRRTPLYDFHLANGARMVPFAGWDMPVQYADGIKAEHLATRESAGLFDVSHMAQVWIGGADADAALERLTPTDIGAIAEGRVRYSLFLDENGEKISKSRGNWLTIEEWLAYAPPESLSLYMFQNPRKAKRLYFDVIPKAVDEYISFVDKYAEADAAQKLTNSGWDI